MRNSFNRGNYGHEIQTVPGTLRGYRAWRVDRDWRFLGLHNTSLLSLGRRLWSPTAPEPAVCSPGVYCQCGYCPDCRRRREHRSPVDFCSCGYYATYDPDAYRMYVNAFGTFVHGSVKAYGLISLGTLGFRAEYARVEAVYGRGARAVARRYKVPWFRNQEKMLAEFPPPDVAELLR